MRRRGEDTNCRESAKLLVIFALFIFYKIRYLLNRFEHRPLDHQVENKKPLSQKGGFLVEWNKDMRKSEVIILIIILSSFVVGAYFYPQMPEKMASHWNIQGQVDGYMSKFWGLFLMPFISIGMFLLFILIPKIDPLKANIEKFRKYFDGFIILVIVFLFYIYLLTIFWNIGLRFNIGQLIIPALAILFYYCGVLIENAKRNWFIGIRTPWTLSNDKVWEKTHQLGGKFFKMVGIVALFGIFFPNYAFFFVLVPVILVAIYTIIYSYFEYKKEIG